MAILKWGTWSDHKEDTQKDAELASPWCLRWTLKQSEETPAYTAQPGRGCKGGSIAMASCDKLFLRARLAQFVYSLRSHFLGQTFYHQLLAHQPLQTTFILVLYKQKKTIFTK